MFLSHTHTRMLSSLSEQAVDARKLHQSVTVFRRAAALAGDEAALSVLTGLLDGIQTHP